MQALPTITYCIWCVGSLLETLRGEHTGCCSHSALCIVGIGFPPAAAPDLTEYVLLNAALGQPRHPLLPQSLAVQQQGLEHPCLGLWG